MRLIARNIVAVTAPLLVAGCDGFMSLGVGTNDDANTADVAVRAEVHPDDNIISYTVKNIGPDTVYLTKSYLERRQGDRWRWVDAGEPEPLVLNILPLSSADDFSGERLIEDGPETLAPGEYRYHLLLFADKKMQQPLPEKVRTSNAVRIE